MTTTELITFVKDLQAYDLDHMRGEAPTDAEVVSSLNWALRVFSRALYLYDMSVTQTLTIGTHTYPMQSGFSKRIIYPYRAMVGTTAMRNRRGSLGLYTVAELDKDYPTWRTVTAGTIKVVATDGSNIIVAPKPDSAVTLTIGGRVLAPDLSHSTGATAPEIPVECHEALGMMAAVRSALPNVTENEGWARIRAYDETWPEMVEQIARANWAQAGFGEPYSSVVQKQNMDRTDGNAN